MRRRWKERNEIWHPVNIAGHYSVTHIYCGFPIASVHRWHGTTSRLRSFETRVFPEMSALRLDRPEMSWLWNASRNPSPATFPFFCGMGHESASDCHDAADSRASSMAETKQECCCRSLSHSHDIFVLATS